MNQPVGTGRASRSCTFSILTSLLFERFHMQFPIPGYVLNLLVIYYKSDAFHSLFAS